MSDQISYVGETPNDEYLDVTFYRNIHMGEETDFIKILVPGDKTLTIDTVATDQHKARFRRKWEAYNNMQQISGTPLSEWTELPEGLRQEFIYQGFKYIEQVAGGPDSAFTRMMGGTQWRVKAQAWLNRGKIDADAVIKEQADQIKELQEKMAILMGALNEQPKRGRKPKEAEE